MLHQDNHFSSTLSDFIHDKNNISTWEQVYDKYAPMMYGTIINMTHDEKMAGDILQEVFLDLKKKDIIPVFLFL